MAKKRGNTRPYRRRRGFSLIEMGIVIALIGVFVGIYLLSGGGLFSSAKITAAQESVLQLYSAATSCWLSRGRVNFTGISISQLASMGCLASSFTGDDANPWGGDISIQANASDASKLDIVLTGIPDDDGQALAANLSQRASSVSFSNGTLTVTF